MPSKFQHGRGQWNSKGGLKHSGETHFFNICDDEILFFTVNKILYILILNFNIF